MQIDRVKIIKDRLSMYDVLNKYGFEPKKRMCCPLHNGKDKNFSITESGYICFSHCGTGDIITFVQKLFSLSFGETLRKIDSDFCLGLYGAIDPQERVRLERKSQSLQCKRKAEQEGEQQLNNEYWEAFDELERLKANKVKYAPKTSFESWHPLFIEALQKIDYQEYLLGQIEERRYANGRSCQ